MLPLAVQTPAGEALTATARPEVAAAWTSYVPATTAGMGGGLVLRQYNLVAPMEAEGTPVTAEPDAVTGAR